MLYMDIEFSIWMSQQLLTNKKCDILAMLSAQHSDTQKNDTQKNDTQKNDTQMNDM